MEKFVLPAVCANLSIQFKSIQFDSNQAQNRRSIPRNPAWFSYLTYLAMMIMIIIIMRKRQVGRCSTFFTRYTFFTEPKIKTKVKHLISSF